MFYNSLHLWYVFWMKRNQKMAEDLLNNQEMNGRIIHWSLEQFSGVVHTLSSVLNLFPLIYEFVVFAMNTSLCPSASSHLTAIKADKYS